MKKEAYHWNIFYYLRWFEMKKEAFIEIFSIIYRGLRWKKRHFIEIFSIIYCGFQAICNGSRPVIPAHKITVGHIQYLDDDDDRKVL